MGFGTTIGYNGIHEFAPFMGLAEHIFRNPVLADRVELYRNKNMMISLYRTVMMLILMSVVSGCSLLGGGEPEYLASVEADPLIIPDGLDAPVPSEPVLIGVPEMRMPSGDELEPMPPRVVSTAGQQDANAYLAWSAEGAYLLVKDTPDSVATRLRYAIENTGMTLLESDESGAHKFHYSQPKTTADEGFFSRLAFWRGSDRDLDYSGTFMTSLRPDGMNTRVYLLFGNGEQVDTAGTEHILGIFMERFG